MFGVVGEDDESRLLNQLLQKTGITDHFLIPLADRTTTVKTRIVAHSQHVVRIDQETTEPITATTRLYKFSPVTPEAPNVLKSQPPTTAPTIP